MNKTAESFINSDFESIIDFTYPSIIEKAGGKAVALQKVKEDIDYLRRNNITYDSVSFGDPTTFVKAGDEIHTIIPETIFMRSPRGRLKSDSYVIAISKDNGKKWYFIDTAAIDSSNVKNILPNYNFELKIPAYKNPVLIDSI